uniref:Uncharacterized protein n=1 Tax=Triticum urartu TaxID=4572 RepID=A0A8R7UKL5_TRIUA
MHESIKPKNSPYCSRSSGCSGFAISCNGGAVRSKVMNKLVDVPFLPFRISYDYLHLRCTCHEVPPGLSVNAGQRERDEVHARGRGGAQRWEAREVARRGDVGHAVAALGESLGELQVREQVAEREPRDDHYAQRRGCRSGVHGAIRSN